VSTTSSRLLVIAAGSGSRTGGDAGIGLTVRLDGEAIGELGVAATEAFSSRAMVREAFAVEAAAGAHGLEVVAHDGTVIGADDRIDVTVIELGAAGRAVPVLSRPGDAGLAVFDGALTAVSGRGVLLVAGSGSGADVGYLGMQVRIDDREVAASAIWSDEPGSHKAFVPVQAVLQVAPGPHRVTLSRLSGTLIDAGDRVSVLWLELGDDAIASQLLARAGGMPLTAPLSTSGGPVLLISSGSAVRASTGPLETMVRIGDTVALRSGVHAREAASHKALVASAGWIALPAGEHTIRVAPGNEPTAAEHTDGFELAAIALPP
jgi:hypothetical protein